MISNFGNIVVTHSFRRGGKRRFFRFERFPWCLSNAILGRKVLYFGSQSTVFRVAKYVISSGDIRYFGSQSTVFRVAKYVISSGDIRYFGSQSNVTLSA